MPAPTVRAGTAATATNNPTSPSSTEIGDLVLVVHWTRGAAGIPTHTLQSGFTTILSHGHNDGSTDGRLSVAYKVATSAGATSYNAYTSDTGTDFAGIVLITKDTYHPTLIGDVNVGVTATGTGAPDPSAVTTPAYDCMVMAVAAWHLGSAATVTVGPPTNYTEVWEMAGSNTAELSVATREIAARGSQNPGAFTDDVTPNGSCCITIAFRPKPPTRFYLSSTPWTLNTPGFHAGWEHTGEAVRRRAVPGAKSSTAFENLAASESVSSGARRDVLIAQYVSPPLAGTGTLSGAVWGLIRCAQSATGGLIRSQICIKVVSGDGSTVRGTVYNFDDGGAGTEWSTGAQGAEYFPRSGIEVALTSSVAWQDGDRIVIEVGYGAENDNTTTHTGTIHGGDNAGSDHAGEDETTELNPWIELTQNLPFDIEIFGSGVGTGEALGSSHVAQTHTASGVASAEAHGSTTVELAAGGTFIDASAIATGEAFGTAMIVIGVAPSAITSAEAFGTAVLQLLLDGSGIATTEAFGTPIEQQNLDPGGIASGEVHGSPFIDPLNILPGGIASAETFGTATEELKVDAGSIGSAEAHGSPSFAAAITSSAIASAETHGSPTLEQAIAASGVASAETFGTAIASTTLTASGVASAEALGSPNLTATDEIVPSAIASAEAHGTTALALAIDAAGVGSAEALGAPAAVLVLGASGIPSLEALGSPSLASALSAAAIASAETFGTHSLAPAILVDPAAIASAEALGSALLESTITAAGVASAEAFGTATESTTVSPVAIGTAEAVGAPNLVLVLGPSAAASGEAFGTAVLRVDIALSAIASAETFGIPALAEEGDILATGIASAETHGAPSLLEAIILVGVASGEVVGAVEIGVVPSFVEATAAVSISYAGTAPVAMITGGAAAPVGSAQSGVAAPPAAETSAAVPAGYAATVGDT